MSAVVNVCSYVWFIIINCFAYVAAKTASINASTQAINTMISQAIINQNAGGTAYYLEQDFEDTEADFLAAQAHLDQADEILTKRRAALLAKVPNPSNLPIPKNLFY